MNSAKYPASLFNAQELIMGCAELFLSGNDFLIQNALRFLSLSIYTTDNLSKHFIELFPLIFNLTNNNSNILVKRYFSLITNIFTDLKENNNYEIINEIINKYYPNIIKYILSLGKVYEEELNYLMVLSSFISSAKYPDIYSQFTLFLFNFLDDQITVSNSMTQSIVLWCIYENCKHSPDQFSSNSLSPNFVRHSIDQIKNADSFPSNCLEPILIIIRIFINAQQDASIVRNDDLPTFLFYCMSNNTNIQFDSLQLVRDLIQYFPIDFVALNIVDLFAISSLVPFKSSNQIFLIACALLSFLPSTCIESDFELINRIVSFVIQNININDESAKFALCALIKIKEDFAKSNKQADFQNVFDEANQSGAFDDLRENECIDIIALVSKFDSI